MRRFPMWIVAMSMLAAAAVAVQAMAQDNPGRQNGGQGGEGGRGGAGGDQGGEGGRGGPGGPGGGRGRGFHLLPPFVMEKLNLTQDQQKQLVALEKEAKAKLDKILTPAQQKILASARPPRPGQGGQGRQGRQGGQGEQDGPGGQGGPGGGRHRPGGPGQGGPGGDDRGGDQPARPQRPAPQQ